MTRRAIFVTVVALGFGGCVGAGGGDPTVTLSGAPAPSGSSAGAGQLATTPTRSVDGGASASWRVESAGVTDDLTALWGSGPEDVYLAGANGRLYHSTGRGDWSARVSGQSAALTSIWGDGPNDLFVTAASGAILHSSDGIAFTALAAVPIAPATIWGAGSELFVGGADPSGAPALYHSTDRGNSFSPIGTPLPPSLTFFCPAGATVAGAGHLEGTLTAGGYRSTDGGRTFRFTDLHTDGRGIRINGLWGSGADLYVFGGFQPRSALGPVAPFGVVFHSADAGQTFGPMTNAGLEYLQAAWSSGPGDVYAAGERGSIVHSTDGAHSFQVIAAPTNARLSAVWGSGPNDVYVAGASGTLLHYAL